MGSLFSKPKMPTLATAPITSDTQAVKDAAKAEADRLRKRRGMRSTILTGSEGVTDQAQTLKATLG